MKKSLRWLSGLLALQLVIAVGLFIGMKSSQETFRSRPLLELPAQGLDKLTVTQGDKAVTLVLDNKQWRVAELRNLPADPVKVEDTLRNLRNLKTTWPVTTSSASHVRFEVAPDKFARKVSLYAGEKLLDELLLGTSPGFKQVYARSVNDDNVYSLGLNAYELADTAFGWLDKGLLSVKNISAVEGAERKLTRTGEQWTLEAADGNASNRQSSGAQDDARIATFIQGLESLQVLGLAENAPNLNVSDATTLKVTGDSKHTFQLLKQNEKYYIARDDIEVVFTVTASVYETLAGISNLEVMDSAVGTGDHANVEPSGATSASTPAQSSVGP